MPSKTSQALRATSFRTTRPANGIGPSILAALVLTIAAIGAAVSEHDVTTGASASGLAAIVNAQTDVAPAGDVNAHTRVLPPITIAAGPF